MGGSAVAAIQVATAFVAGMAVSDTLDGYATARLSAGDEDHALNKFRRRLGCFVSLPDMPVLQRSTVVPAEEVVLQEPGVVARSQIPALI